jgi:multiple sugar transport system ATP-binding protein
VRAEHVTPGGAMPAKAEVVERLGDRTLVHARLGDGSNLVYEDSGDSAIKVGDAVGLSIPRGFVHLFDAQGRACRAA